MNDLTPADCLAITIAAGLALYVGYRIIMRAADRVIKAISELTRFE